MDNQTLRQILRTVPDWPKPGVNFFDICSIVEVPEAFKWTVDNLVQTSRNHGTSAIVCPDARGFLWGSAVAYASGLPLHLARKPGKLPGNLVTQSYEYEYSSASVSLQADTALAGKKVLLVDDVLATGGTALAIVDLLMNHFKVPAADIEIGTVINLAFLGGVQKLKNRGVSVTSLLDYHE